MENNSISMPVKKWREAIYFNKWKRIKMPTYKKKWLPAEFHLEKPGVHPLCAEVPCNYIHGRLAAALQSIFSSCNSASRHFFNIQSFSIYYIYKNIYIDKITYNMQNIT